MTNRIKGKAAFMRRLWRECDDWNALYPMGTAVIVTKDDGSEMSLGAAADPVEQFARWFEQVRGAESDPTWKPRRRFSRKGAARDDRVLADLGLERVPVPGFTNDEMQEITYAAKMAALRCLERRRKGSRR